MSMKIGSNKSKLNVSDDDPQELSNSKSVSFLNPDTISWLNRHRPKNKVAGGMAQMFLTPSKAFQLREIFRGLDFDGSGGITLEEMDEALEFVSKSGTGSFCLFCLRFLLLFCFFVNFTNFYVFKVSLKCYLSLTVSLFFSLSLVSKCIHTSIFIHVI